MASAAPELPEIEDQHAFNLARWEELCADPFLATLDFRIESDAHGHVLMSPPPAIDHSDSQGRVLEMLIMLGPSDGRALPEAPISTTAGVRGADVAWISNGRFKSMRGQKAFTTAPEICIEILSPSNTQAEIDEKKRLYFEAGAAEVWICGLKRDMRFFLAASPDSPATSALCPDFPKSVPIDD